MMRPLVLAVALALSAAGGEPDVAARLEADSLLTVLEGSGATARDRAGRALLHLVDVLPAIRERLERLVRSPDPWLRPWGAILLARVDPDAEGLTPPLGAALAGHSSARRNAALVSIANVGPRARPLLDTVTSHLRSAPSETALDAFLALEPPAELSLEVLLDLLGRASRRPDPVRARAALLLAERGEEAKDAIPRLVAALAEPWKQPVHIGATLRLNECVGHPFAAGALGRFGPLAGTAVPALADHLDLRHPWGEELGIRIVRALGEIGPRAAKTLAHLTDEAARIGSVYELELRFARARVDPEEPLRVEEIATALRAGRGFLLVMSRPWYGLPAVGPADRRLLPALEEGLEAPDPGTRVACARLIREIAGEPGAGLPMLLDLLAHEDPEVRLTAALELARGGVEADRAIEHFRGILAAYRGGEIFHVPVVLRALLDLGPGGAAAAPEVGGSLHGPWEVYRLPALRCLARLGPGAAVAEPDVTPFLGDPDPELRAAARAALRAFE